MTAEDKPSIVVERLDAAMNAHDREAFLACFQDDYESEQPAHPDRAFGGREQVRRNWSAGFDGVPDFRSELLRSAADGDTVWTEWHWQGMQLALCRAAKRGRGPREGSEWGERLVC